MQSNGDNLTHLYVAVFLTISLPDAVNINTHSFRIGGASTAASGGVPDSIIQWASGGIFVWTINL